MKQYLALLMALLMAVSALTGCGTEQSADGTTQSTQPTQSPEEQKVEKILLIGNSHSNDVFWTLYNVFKDQQPDKELVLGVMYYNGCSIAGHVKFTKNEEAVYDYHKNSDGTWKTTKESSLRYALEDEQWDTIMYQSAQNDLDESLNRSGRRILESYIAGIVTTPYHLVFHNTYPGPNDPTFFDPAYEVQPPAGFKDRLMALYGFDPVTQYKAKLDLVKANILTDDTYHAVYNSGASVMYAHLVLGIPQTHLWRDYVHLSDYGRLIAAYGIYAQMTGQPITSVNMDALPAYLRHQRFRSLGDLTITEEMKQVIITSANHALEDPWSVPGQ